METAVDYESRMAFEKAIRNHALERFHTPTDFRGGIMNFGRCTFMYLDSFTQAKWEAWKLCWDTHVLPRLTKETLGK